MATVQEHGDGFRYQFWDVPSPPRWNWILGVPAGLLAGLLLVRYLFRRQPNRRPIANNS
ncbi:MAG: hypothetical protein L0Y71_09520 [Gemmataceae bacterium]|nr:hypothetical protein [Gemmataceae bacterium]